MAKHKSLPRKLIPIVLAFFVGGLLFFATALIAYKLGVENKGAKQMIEQSTLIPANAIPAATPKSENPPAVAPIPINNANSQAAKDQTLKDCLDKLEDFKSFSFKMGYPQNDIDAFVQLGEYDCDHPSNSTGTKKPSYHCTTDYMGGMICQ